MPHIIVSTKITLQNGPCFVGDEQSDKEIMEKLGARLEKELGKNYAEWITDDIPRNILDKLEVLGYRVISMTGVGQTCIWTCYKPLEPAQQANES